MAAVKYFGPNMQPLPTRDGCDKMQVVLDSGTVVVMASLVNSVWHWSRLIAENRWRGVDTMSGGDSVTPTVDAILSGMAAALEVTA